MMVILICVPGDQWASATYPYIIIIVILQCTMFRCNICGQVSGSRRAEAEEHSETHILGLRFPCRVCRRVLQKAPSEGS